MMLFISVPVFVFSLAACVETNSAAMGAGAADEVKLTHKIIEKGQP